MCDEGTRISYCEIVQFDSSLAKTFLRYVGPACDMYSHLFNMWLVYPLPIHSLLFHRDVFNDVGLFKEDFTVCEDYDLWLKFTSLYEVGFVDKLLVNKYLIN